MKTDRELLELAAKAHGFIDDQIDESDAHGLNRSGQGIYYVVHQRGWHNWNPLTDDGDALRLAVKLDIAVTPYPIYDKPKHSVLAQLKNMDDSRFEVMEMHGSDPSAATRRAIVRAAAAIGESM